MFAMNKVLIVGGDSFIGQDLQKFWSNQNFEIYQTTRSKKNTNKIFFDLEQPDFSCFSSNYSFIVFLAGISSIDFCKNHPKLSRKINVTNTIKSLNFFETICSNILFISSADVFQGDTPRHKTDSPQKPKNLYGAHKAMVEKHIQEKSTYISILRLSKVIHSQFKLFEEWADQISKGNKIYPYSNKFFSPTSMDNVLKKINLIMLDNKTCIYHCYGDDDISYYEYAINFLPYDKNSVISSIDPLASSENFFSSLDDD